MLASQPLGQRDGGAAVLDARRGHCDSQDEAKAAHHQVPLAGGFTRCPTHYRGTRHQVWIVYRKLSLLPMYTVPPATVGED
jgi:hypothetical protein